MPKKFDMLSIVASVRKQMSDTPNLAMRVGVGSDLSELTDKDFIKMPTWWKEVTGVIGIPFGRIVMIAGDSDTGKTSAAIEAIRAAQAQDVGVIYVETENKTTKADLTDWGIDVDNISLVQSSIAEDVFELMFATWDTFKKKYPTDPLLVVFDSIGNIVSKRDVTINLSEQDSKPGGKGKINRLALNKMIAKRDEDNAAMLFLNYTYDNIGSPGKTNAGGKALNFFSSLTYQTTRKAWYEPQVKNKKVRAGVDVVWKLFKNHLDRRSTKTKEATLRITSAGFEVLDIQ